MHARTDSILILADSVSEVRSLSRRVIPTDRAFEHPRTGSLSRGPSAGEAPAATLVAQGCLAGEGRRNTPWRFVTRGVGSLDWVNHKLATGTIETQLPETQSRSKRGPWQVSRTPGKTAASSRSEPLQRGRHGSWWLHRKRARVRIVRSWGYSWGEASLKVGRTGRRSREGPAVGHVHGSDQRTCARSIVMVGRRPLKRHPPRTQNATRHASKLATM